MPCKTSLLVIGIIFAFIAPIIRTVITFYDYMEHGQHMGDTPNVAIVEDDSDGLAKTITYLIGTGMLVYVHICRYCQTERGFLPTMGIMIAVTLTVSDVLLLLLDFSFFPTIRAIWIGVFFISATWYQFVHVIISYKTVQDHYLDNKIIKRVKMSYLVLILLITVIAQISAILNSIILMVDQPMIQRIAVAAINIFFWGFIPFFIAEIYEIRGIPMQHEGERERKQTTVITMEAFSAPSFPAPSAPTLTTPLTPPEQTRPRVESGMVDWESLRLQV